MAGGDGEDTTDTSASSGDPLANTMSTMVIVGVVATAINVLIVVALGLVCLRHRHSHKDIDEFLAQEEAAATTAKRAGNRSRPVPAASQPALLPSPSSPVNPAAVPALSSAQPLRMEGVENQSFDMYATSDGEH